MNIIFQVLSAIVLLGVSTCLAFKGMAAEMTLSIVAGSMGLAFSNLDKFKSIKGAGFEAELQDKVETLIESVTEPSISSDAEDRFKSVVLSENQRKVLVALRNTSYKFRSVNGLINDSGIDIKEIGKEINFLEDKGYTTHSFGKQGSIYSLTKKGLQLCAVLDLREK